jgi:hypothetical protein
MQVIILQLLVVVAGDATLLRHVASSPLCFRLLSGAFEVMTVVFDAEKGA